MADFTIAGQNYKSRKMNAFAQFHVARRLGPIFSSLADAFKRAKRDDAGNILNQLDVFEPVATALAALKDNDAEYVLNSCLATCQRQNSNLWSEVLSPQGVMMFQDIDLQVMMQIAWNVLQDNFGNFFNGQPGPISSTQESKA